MLAALLASGVGACNADQMPIAGARIRAAEDRVRGLEQAATQRDSLLSELLNATQILGEIHSELEKLRGADRAGRFIVVRAGERPTPVARYRDSLVARVRGLRERLAASEERLGRSAERLAALSRVQPQLVAQIDELQASLAEYRSVLEENQQSIAALNIEVAQLRTQRDLVTTEKAAAEEKLVDAMETSNTVYVLAATRAQLLELGVVGEEGGGRSLLALGRKRGAMLVASRTLDPSDFTAMNRSPNEVIPRLQDGRLYHLVSRHDAQLLDPLPNQSGLVRAPIRVSNPEIFWTISRFLILEAK